MAIRQNEGRPWLFRMNPALWRVTYHLQTAVGNRAISNDSGHTALDNVQNHLRRHPAWRSGAALERIEVELLDGVRGSVVAQDLMACTARQRYSFECFTAAALVQFVGVYRGLQTADATTADVTFDRSYGDFRKRFRSQGILPSGLGGSMLAFNLANRPEFLVVGAARRSCRQGSGAGRLGISQQRKLYREPALSKAKMLLILVGSVSLVTVSVYLPSSNTPKHCAAVIVRGCRLTQILNQVRVGPRYRAPNSVGRHFSPTPTP